MGKLATEACLQLDATVLKKHIEALQDPRYTGSGTSGTACDFMVERHPRGFAVRLRGREGADLKPYRSYIQVYLRPSERQHLTQYPPPYLIGKGDRGT